MRFSAKSNCNFKEQLKPNVWVYERKHTNQMMQIIDVFSQRFNKLHQENQQCCVSFQLDSFIETPWSGLNKTLRLETCTNIADFI